MAPDMYIVNLMNKHNDVIEHMYEQTYGKNNSVTSLEEFKADKAEEFSKMGAQKAKHVIAIAYNEMQSTQQKEPAKQSQGNQETKDILSMLDDISEEKKETSTYEEDLKDDKQHGQGTLTDTDGGQLIGEFKDDNINGRGTFTYPDGGQYIGEFKDGELDGQGTFTSPDGTKDIMNIPPKLRLLITLFLLGILWAGIYLPLQSDNQRAMPIGAAEESDSQAKRFDQANKI